MFGRMMNNFYYGKSGKGDYRKEDLPKNRWQLFWEMLRIRFSALIRLNLMYMVVWLPAMIVLMIGAMSALTALSAVAAEGGIDYAALSDTMGSILITTLTLLIPCIAITGPFTAGVCYVTRNWARDEHAFIWSDFKDAVKENWKQGLAISCITGLAPLVIYVCWNFYGAMAAQNALMIIPQILTAMVGLVWTLALTYFYPLMVSYNLKMRQLMRNAMLLAIARFPQTLGLRLLQLFPALLALACAFFFSPMWSVLGLFAYYALLGFGLSRFITASYTNAVFDRYINSRIAGAVINRGLSAEEDDEDDDEEDEDVPQG